jgi:hypothetical protein
MKTKPRILSGVQPSAPNPASWTEGQLKTDSLTGTHLGNYVGAFRQWVEMQRDFEAFYMVVDLHAITLAYDHRQLADRTLEVAAILLACGLDPEVCTVFVQSHVPEHTELTWLLNHLATVGELRRMTQFKAKAAEGGEGALPAGYFNYPVLQAADILIYQADRVPVGEDQRQHLELTRDIAERFNARFGETFVVPEAYIPKVGGRVMDLQNPTAKMSKSSASPAGRIEVLDSPDGDPAQGPLGRDRLGPRGAGPAGQAGDLQPAGAVLGGHRQGGERAGAGLRRPRLRRLQGRPGRRPDRLPGPGARALPPSCAATRPASPPPSSRARPRPRPSPARTWPWPRSAWASCRGTAAERRTRGPPPAWCRRIGFQSRSRSTSRRGGGRWATRRPGGSRPI